MIEKKINLLIVILLFSLKINAQENEFTRSSIKTGIGVGINDGIEESGLGFVYSVGYQKSFGKKEKFRINPNLLYGGFNSSGITDTREQFFRITSIGMNVNYDLVKYKSVSLLITSGGFLNYSRVLFGTGGENEIRNSRYFNLQSVSNAGRRCRNRSANVFGRDHSYHWNWIIGNFTLPICLDSHHRNLIGKCNSNSIHSIV